MNFNFAALKSLPWTLGVAAIVGSAPLAAAELPALKATAAAPVPACATPGRLHAFLKSRNADLDKRFDQIAVAYMRHGEEFGLRWDYAFFHMIAETGSLSFKGQIRTKAISAGQNNFAGLGAAGSESGESFPDVSTGVKAHLQHLKLYSGDKVESPIAERTRKIQQEGTLGNLEVGLKRPVTYNDFVTRWAPSLKSYPQTLDGIAQAFYGDHCKRPDPKPELTAEARGGSVTAVASAKRDDAKPDQKADDAIQTRASGAELARKAIADGKIENDNKRAALGAANLASAAPSVRVLNAPAFDEEAAPKSEQPAAAALPPAARAEPVKPTQTAATVPPLAPKKQAAAPQVKTAPPVVQTAAAAAAAAPAHPAAQLPSAADNAARHAAPKVADGGACNVLTASYGGARALIIKHAAVAGVTSYTVLDVNDGREQREAAAYISAYAKGGNIAGTFGTQNEALEKAFELCPEG